MLLVSTTLTHECPGIIGDALLSVLPFVDACIVIDTAGSSQTMGVASQVCGSKLVTSSFPWVNDFAAARNFSLREAERIGADWAITLDTDERIDLRGLDLRSYLEASQRDVHGMEHAGKTYSKIRVIRLPAKAQWEMPTHEAYSVENSSLLPDAVFSELPKSPEQLRVKIQRDIEILTALTQRGAENQRAWYYLGASHHDLGEYRKAIDAFLTCGKLRDWPEERSRAAYRASECFYSLGEYDACLALASVSLVLFAGMAEAAWMAGRACDKLGRSQDAYAWALMAESLGFFRGAGRYLRRGGFSTPTALWEGPYDLMRSCAPTNEQRHVALLDYQQALEARR